MKKVNRRLFFPIFVLLFAQGPLASPFQIVIDPGHGGVDAGATRYGLREADIALAVSKKLHDLLKKDRRFSVVMTRHEDETLSLKQRALAANRSQGGLFLSIHANSSPDHRVHGPEFYFQNQLPPSEEALFLAARENEVDKSPELQKVVTSMTDHKTDNVDVLAIVDDLIRNHRIVKSDELALSLVDAWQGRAKNRKKAIRQAPFYLISNVQMPSVLVEIGYMTNKQEAEALADADYQRKIAQNIYDGIVQFKRLQESGGKEILDKK